MISDLSISQIELYKFREIKDEYAKFYLIYVFVLCSYYVTSIHFKLWTH